MNTVSFNGAYHNNLNPQNNEKKNVKKIAAAAIITTGAVVGGVALYKNRNSKPVQKTVEFAKDNVISPIKKAGSTLKKKALEAIDSIKASVKKLNAKKEKVSNPVDINDSKASTTASELTDKPKIKNKPKKIKTKKNVQKPVTKLKNTGAEAPKSDIKTIKPDIVITDSKNPKDGSQSILDLAKKNATQLRTAGAGVTAGAIIGTGAMGVVDKINEKKQLEDKKFIIKMNGKEFKGTFKGEDGKAHDEDGGLLNGKVVVVYNGNFGKEYNPDAPRILKKTIMQYENGVLKKATHFDDIDDKNPTHIKHYQEGHVTRTLEDIVLDGKQIKSSTAKGFGIKDSIPMMNTKKYIDEDGVETIEYYKRNTDEDGKIIGKPIHTTTVKNKRLGQNCNLATFYAEPKKYGCIDRVLKTIETKPGGETEITLTDRSNELDNAVGKIILGSDKKIKEYKLLVPGDMYDPRSPDGVLLVEDGRLVYSNDDMTAWENGKKMAEQNPELDEEFGNFGLACYQDANLKMDTLIRGTRFIANDEEYTIDDSFVGKDGDTRVGIVHNDDGTIKAIAAYYGVDHHIESGSVVYPDCVTFFKNGVPVKDIHYDENDNKLFETGYDFRK